MAQRAMAITERSEGNQGSSEARTKVAGEALTRRSEERNFDEVLPALGFAP
jgi:hypothetical protein